MGSFFTPSYLTCPHVDIWYRHIATQPKKKNCMQQIKTGKQIWHCKHVFTINLYYATDLKFKLDIASDWFKDWMSPKQGAIMLLKFI